MRTEEMTDKQRIRRYRLLLLRLMREIRGLKEDAEKTIAYATEKGYTRHRTRKMFAERVHEKCDKIQTIVEIKNAEIEDYKNTVDRKQTRLK